MASDPRASEPTPPDMTPGGLLRRAYGALVARGEAMAPEELVPVVFGAAVGTGTWEGLLRQMLAGSDLFTRLPDGRWSLAEWSAEDLPLEAVEFAVVDVETTGLSPTRHRLIEVAAIIVQGDATRAVFQQLIQPERRIPDFITQFTGISNEMVRGAPKVAQVLPELQTFLGRRPIVGHNVGFDLGFLNHAAEQGHWFFPTEGIDTIALARRFIPGIRRLKLDVLAARLGVHIRDRHRALGDAETTADVLRILLAKARQEGVRTLAELRTAMQPFLVGGPPTRGANANPRPTGNLYLNPAWRKEFPDKPGVYLMHDETGKVIYVGKAKVLKERLASYYNHPLGYTRKMDGLLQSVRSIETRVLGSELEALLVESQLIKQLQPRYNVQLRNYELYPFIKVDVRADFPRVMATREVKADGARYFGPFNSRRAVDATVELIQKIFPVRTCTRTLPPAAKPSDPCLRYHMGRCPAPCRGGTSPGDYRPVIAEVLDFLGGSRDDLVAKLHQKMWEASERDDFERAAALRDAIKQVDQVLLGQKLMTSAIEANNLLIAYPSAAADHAELFLVRHGRLVEQRRVPGAADPIQQSIHDLLQRAIWLGPVPTRVGKQEVDQINIIARWVHRHSQDQGRAFWALPTALDVPAEVDAFCLAVVERILQLIRAPDEVFASTSRDAPESEAPHLSDEHIASEVV